MSTLTPQVVRPAGVDDEGCGGTHGGRLLSVDRQHGEVLLGDEADGVPLAVVQARACGTKGEVGGEKRTTFRKKPLVSVKKSGASGSE